MRAGSFTMRTAPFRAVFRAAVLLAVVLALPGCSRLSFVFGYAEHAVSRDAAYYLDLKDDGERAFVDGRIAAAFGWHRAVMLPRYARFLSAQADVIEQGPPDRAAFDATMAELRRLFDDLVAGAAPYTAAVLVRYTAPDKVRDLKERMAYRLAEKQEDAREPPAERLEDRIERITDNFERFVGDLTDDQKRIVRRYAEATMADTAAWLANRADRQRAFTDFLSRRPDKAAITAFVHRIVLRPYDIVDPGYKDISERRWQRFEDMLYGIMTSLTDEQRETLVAKLRGYAAEMLELSS